MRLPRSLVVALLVFSPSGPWPLLTCRALKGVRNSSTSTPPTTKPALERDLIDKRLAAMDKRLAELEKVEFAAFDRVADPTGTDYWESISDTVLFATAKQDIRKGELLVYHFPGIYRVKDFKPKLTTKSECWYFRPDRDIKLGRRMTIELVYDAPEEIALAAKGFFPSTDRARDPDRPYNTKIRVGD